MVLQAIFTDKMRLLKPGDVIWGKTLAYINKELTLFEAMEYLATSPLSDAILSPDSRHFTNTDIDIDIHSQVKYLNPLNYNTQFSEPRGPVTRLFILLRSFP